MNGFTSGTDYEEEDIMEGGELDGDDDGDDDEGDGEGSVQRGHY
jgi:hypothetical protein